MTYRPRYRPAMFVSEFDMYPPQRPVRIEDYPIIQEPQTPLEFPHEFPYEQPNFEPRNYSLRDLNDVWF